MEQKIEFVLKAMQPLNFRALCQQYGVSTKTGYKWKERFVQEGLAGMKKSRAGPRAAQVN
jgi:transposase